MDAVLTRAAALAALAPLWLLVATVASAQDTRPADMPVAPSASSPFPTPAPLAIPPPPVAGASDDAPAASAAPPTAAKPTQPPGPPVPVRAPAAVLRVLDKVTAETMAFEAPVGRRVRYKSLVFEVKACETRGLGEAQPQPSAYLIVTSDAAGGALVARQVFKGWIFANYPSLHALRHPVYDAWLVACSAAAPAQ